MIAFLLANIEVVILLSVMVIAAGGAVASVFSIRAVHQLGAIMREIEKARIEVRSHAPLQAATIKPYMERLREEYKRRGMKFEEPSTS